MGKKTIVICLDSFKPAYLKQAKFLSSLAEKYSSGGLETVFGYTSIGSTIMTGKEPEDHGVFTEFKYSPTTSPFKILKYFSFFDNTFFEKPIRLVFNILFNFYRFFVQRKTYLATIKGIPFSAISDFDLSINNNWGLEDKNSFFDRLRKKGSSYYYFDWPIIASNNKIALDFFTKNNDRSKAKNFLKHIDKVDFFWLRLWDLDSIAHRYGTNAQETINHIKELDQLCQTIIETTQNKYEVDFLFWSDHGMVEVERIFDIKTVIQGLPVKMFINSSMVQFWTKDQETEEELKRRLNNTEYGKVLSETDYQKYKINFSNNRYGDLIFLANPGTLIFPNYFQKCNPVKAMHGYDPKYPDQHGIYISNCIKQKEIKRINDLYFDVLELIG